jgi:hypothetical protein
MTSGQGWVSSYMGFGRMEIDGDMLGRQEMLYLFIKKLKKIKIVVNTGHVVEQIDVPAIPRSQPLLKSGWGTRKRVWDRKTSGYCHLKQCLSTATNPNKRTPATKFEVKARILLTIKTHLSFSFIHQFPPAKRPPRSQKKSMSLFSRTLHNKSLVGEKQL